jgi:hypothetical protein
VLASSVDRYLVNDGLYASPSAGSGLVPILTRQDSLDELSEDAWERIEPDML